ncbi:MAG: hypothetical protein IT360_01310 [Gemmatimonadaceae bacterium]|nr:hypothetical protein [Gemmatimonadaceae bacterium]
MDMAPLALRSHQPRETSDASLVRSVTERPECARRESARRESERRVRKRRAIEWREALRT